MVMAIFNVDWVCLPVNVFTELDCVVRPIDYYYDAIVYSTSVFRFRCIFNNNVFQYAVVNITILVSIAGTNVVQVFQAAHLSLNKLIMLLLPLTIVMLPLFTGTVIVLMISWLFPFVAKSCSAVCSDICSVCYCCSNYNGLSRHQMRLTDAGGQEQAELHWYKLSQFTRIWILMWR